MSVDAGQMYVKKADPNAKVEVKKGHGGEGNRTMGSTHGTERFGMSDDHDFANARAGLKKAGGGPVTDEKKLAEARARTGHEVGCVKVSNQLQLKK